MNKELEKWFRQNDEKIKESVNDIATGNNLSAAFKGYYIEGNNLRINGPAIPIYKDFDEYIKNNEYREITHVRYFFDINGDNLNHTATIILEKGERFSLSFSIEELGGGVDLNQAGRLLSSDFSLLATYVKNKFKS